MLVDRELSYRRGETLEETVRAGVRREGRWWVALGVAQNTTNIGEFKQ